MVQGTANLKTEQNKEWLQTYIDNWVTFYHKYTKKGEVASYIPALAKANPDHLGIVITGTNGMSLHSGDTHLSFTLQSISKAISFIAACIEIGISSVLDRVDVEPTGQAFNSIMHLEMKKPTKPFNPFVNAGAISVTSMLPGDDPDDMLKPILDLLEKMLNYRPVVNDSVFQSEYDSSDRNRAIAYFLQETDFLEAGVEQTLVAYFKQCSIEITVENLARIGLILANDGKDPLTDKEIIPSPIARVTKAIMLTCGMYNASGKFAAYIGVPAKSGVSGGILVSVPPRARTTELPFLDGCGIGIYGPALDEIGNSTGGLRLLRHIAQQWDLSVF